MEQKNFKSTLEITVIKILLCVLYLVIAIMMLVFNKYDKQIEQQNRQIQELENKVQISNII